MGDINSVQSSPDYLAQAGDRAAMRAVRLYGPGAEPRVERIPVPTLRANEALLRVLAAGVCHTELQLLDGTLNTGVWPITPGHEIVGQVVELGSAASQSSLLGKCCLVYYSTPCGECSWCLAGQEQVCPDAGPQPGLSSDGGFAEFVRVKAESLVPLPAGLDAASAAPLGCAAATALHALRGVAGVQAGETVVVYGVGGVGLALIQLARLAGARVLAVGRSVEKLEWAKKLGAEVIDGATPDVAVKVRRMTRGEGAQAVFELVASAKTMPEAVNMLRRQGRLVFVGYSGARWHVNPLHLVLREIRILGSLGNTRAELEEVVRLAAEGKLVMPLAATHPLDLVAQTLTSLRNGELVGRAVIVPQQVAEVSSAECRALSAESGAGALPIVNRQFTPLVPAVELRSTTGETSAPLHQESPLAELNQLTEEAGERNPSVEDRHSAVGTQHSALRFPLEDDIAALLKKGIDNPADDDEFNLLALRVFAYQYGAQATYRAFCQGRNATPESIGHWRQIPAVPIGAFKETLLLCEPATGAVEFNSSGTSKPERKSRHLHPSLRLYDANAAMNFKAHLLPDHDRMRMAVLFPKREEMPNSSLAHWLTLMVDRFGSPGSAWYVSNAQGLDFEGAKAGLRGAEASSEPLALLAASFGLVHFLEQCQEQDVHFRLPVGSRVMDTGGYKGRSREYSKADLYGMVENILGVSGSHIVNMYGMTEHGTQFLDTTLRDALSGRNAGRRKFVPPWARTVVVSPETMLDQPSGERGLLLHFDLINRASVMAVLSEDVGYAVDGGFELMGRAEGSEARGCSIALDELIQAVGGR